MIDKTTENWKAQPWWFRCSFLGIRSRRVQLMFEFGGLITGLILSVVNPDNKLSLLFLLQRT